MTVDQLIEALQAIPADVRGADVAVALGGQTVFVQSVRPGFVTEHGSEIDAVEIMQHWSATQPFEVVAVLVVKRDR